MLNLLLTHPLLASCNIQSEGKGAANAPRRAQHASDPSSFLHLITIVTPRLDMQLGGEVKSKTNTQRNSDISSHWLISPMSKASCSFGCIRFPVISILPTNGGLCFYSGSVRGWHFPWGAGCQAVLNPQQLGAWAHTSLLFCFLSYSRQVWGTWIQDPCQAWSDLTLFTPCVCLIIHSQSSYGISIRVTFFSSFLYLVIPLIKMETFVHLSLHNSLILIFSFSFCFPFS